jgi:head-tail adaptor
MQAGKLRHRITIQHDTADPETPGLDGTVTPSWAALHANLPAEVLAVAGGETVHGGVQVQATTTHTIRIRYLANISPEMRIAWGSLTLHISHVRDFDGRRRELFIEATANS